MQLLRLSLSVADHITDERFKLGSLMCFLWLFWQQQERQPAGG
jgi:hypothetical protein